MTEYKRVCHTDKKWADVFLKAENSRSADYNFGNIYSWDLVFMQHIAPVGDRLLTKLHYLNVPFFAFPVGSGDLRPAVEAMEETARHGGFPLKIRGITEENRQLLESVFPGRFVFSEDRDNFDYICLAEKLATYSGKKLHGKRNHCNAFESSFDWHYEPLKSAGIPGCLKMLGNWTDERESGMPGLSDEHIAIARALMHYDRLGLEGGVLYIGEEIVAFTVGEKTSTDTYDIHFEKAYAGINGAYPMICREFARQIISSHPEIKYINREDDMGRENLRTAKMSFCPEFLLKKYTAAEAADVSG